MSREYEKLKKNIEDFEKNIKKSKDLLEILNFLKKYMEKEVNEIKELFLKANLNFEEVNNRMHQTKNKIFEFQNSIQDNSNEIIKGFQVVSSDFVGEINSIKKYLSEKVLTEFSEDIDKIGKDLVQRIDNKYDFMIKNIQQEINDCMNILLKASEEAREKFEKSRKYFLKKLLIFLSPIYILLIFIILIQMFG